MLPDPKAFIRALRLQTLRLHQDDLAFQTAGGLGNVVDRSTALLCLEADGAASLIGSFEQEMQGALSGLLHALEKSGLDGKELAETRAALPSWWHHTSDGPANLFDRFQILTNAVEHFSQRARLYRHPDAAPHLDALYRADLRFRAAWKKATQALIDGLGSLAEADAELSPARVEAFFQHHFSDRRRVTNLRLLPGAHSREVYFFELADHSGTKESFVLRRDRPQNVTPATVAQERPIMDELRRRGFPVAEIVAASDNPQWLGRSFLAMRKLTGREMAEAVPEAPEKFVPLAAKLLGQLHRTPVAGLQFPFTLLSPPWETAWIRLLHETYATWCKHRPYASMTMERAYDWLLAHADCAAAHFTLVHGDFQLPNIFVNGENIVGILDFEVCHLGNPAEDLFAIRPRIEPYFSWDEFYDIYLNAGGVAVSQAEQYFCSVWTPFYYAVITAISYDTFVNHSGYDIAVGGSTLVHLPQLLDFIAVVLERAEQAT